MRLVSRLVLLTVGVVLIASVVPGAVAAVPPCDRLLTLQDITKAAGPGFKAPPPEAAVGNLYLQLAYKVGKQSDPKAALALAKAV